MIAAKLIALFGQLFPTWIFNAADKGAGVSLSAGDRVMAVAGASFSAVRGTVGTSSGKSYFEYLAGSDATDLVVGFGNSSMSLDDYVGSDANGVGYAWNGQFLGNGAVEATYATYTTGDLVQVALDLDNLKVWVGKNNTWQNGDPATGSGGRALGPGTAYAAASGRNGATCSVISPLRYRPPTGFEPL